MDPSEPNIGCHVGSKRLWCSQFHQKIQYLDNHYLNASLVLIVNANSLGCYGLNSLCQFVGSNLVPPIYKRVLWQPFISVCVSLITPVLFGFLSRYNYNYYLCYMK
ncbi:hypothetical protein CLU79DRAFT_768965 [Phycomyces nitens]|nr:hypothetical protein CLU79DRAFT_768965 [Phycomyces nitens]